MGIEKRVSNIESFLDLKSPKWREAIEKDRLENNEATDEGTDEGTDEENDK